jgi:hypothetical protein
MDHFELGVAMAVAHLAELRRHADRRLAGRVPGRTARRRGNRTPGSPRVLGLADHAVAASGTGLETEEGAMLVQHHHEPGLFDAGHCRACARQAGLLEHYWQVQQEEAALRQADSWALEARRRASVALWSAGAALLLAAVALVRG